ncbi:hypothetical protein ACHAQH_009416 [Verticillium albo-atrum]
MNHLHGILVHEGQSPDGLVFHRGDQVTIFDDGRNEGCTTEVHVLNHQSNQAIVVPVSAVCWVPTHSENRPAGVTLFTIYGRRTAHHQPGDSMPSFARRAIQVLLGSNHQVTHSTVGEDDISTWAHQLEETERQSFFTYQWNSLLSEWPCQDTDGLSEGGLSMGTTNSSISSPTTPVLYIDQIGGPRRDSAVDVGCDSPSKDDQGPVCFPSDDYPQCLNLNPYLVSSEPGSPTRYDAMPLPTFAEQQSLVKNAVQPAPATYSAPMCSQPAVEFMANPYLDPRMGQVQYAGNTEGIPNTSPSVTTDFRVNYMYLSSPTSTEDPEVNQQPQRFEAANNDTAWSQQAAQEWPTYQPAEGYHGAQPAGQPVMPAPVNHEAIPRAHVMPMPLTALPEHGQYMTTGQYEPVPIQRFDDRRAETFSAYSMTNESPPAFHRTQERQTVGLTAPSQPPLPISWPPQQPPRPGNGRTPVPHAAPINFRRSPHQQSTAPAFRPELIVDFFTRQVQSHIEALEMRQHEQQNEVLSPEHLPTPSVTESLEAIRNATTEALRVLGTVRPGSMPSFNLTEQRLRGEVEKIIASVQSIRQLALAGNALPRQDRRTLNQQVQSLTGYIEYLGEVFPDMVEPAKAPEPVVSNQAPPASSLSSSQRPSHAVSQANSPVNGMAINREHQRLLRQLAEDVMPPQPRIMVNNVVPASSPPQLASAMPAQDMLSTTSAGPSPIGFHQPVWADPSAPTMVDPAMSMAYPAVQSVSAHSSPYLGPVADPNPRTNYLLPRSVAMATTTSAPGIVSTAPAPLPPPHPPLPRARLPLVLSPRPMPVASFDRRSSLPGRRVAQSHRERERQRAAPYPPPYRGTTDRKGSI